jgi:putative oxidoreductase
MFDQRTTPYAALVMRLALGILFLAHFSLKFFAFTPPEPPGFSSRSVFPAGWPISPWPLNSSAPSP